MAGGALLKAGNGKWVVVDELPMEAVDSEGSVTAAVELDEGLVEGEPDFGIRSCCGRCRSCCCG